MERTKQALANSAVALFIEQGYDETSIDEIAAAAGVSRRTFFRYFPTKEDVILQPMIDEIDQLAEELEARPRDESIQDSLCEVAKEHKRANPRREVARAMYRSVRSTPTLRGVVATFLDHFRDRVASWAADRLGLPVDDLTVQLIAAGATAARETSLRLWVESDGEADYAMLIDEAYGALVGPAVEQATLTRAR
jgi:AcrR family transcriptional regulator